MASHYTPEEQLAARIIASCIYPDWPGGADLTTDPTPLGLYARAVIAVRDPYELATELMPRTGKLYDSPTDAATAWEGLRQMTGTVTPYARIDPLVRELGAAIAAPATTKAVPKRTVPRTVEYVNAPEQPESQIIIERLRALGYEFRLNSCSDTIECNGHQLTEIMAAEIRTRLRDVGLAKKLSAAEDAYITEAKAHSYHAVQDYLTALTWDGGDYIATLIDFMRSSDPPVAYRTGERVPLHGVYLHRWLIGACAKAFNGSQNPMLVWDGPQGIGKSTLARWLCPLPEYFIESAINPSDKDADVRLMSYWIWEVSELDATTRKADQSALKSFITKQVVTVRKSYGRLDTKKAALASLIGTVNNTSGFLADESGNRRFMITRLEYIDRRYQQLDVNQIWAQAMHLYQSGEGWELRGEEAAAQAANNERYEAESILEDWLYKYFMFDRAYQDKDAGYSLADIIAVMAADGVRLSGSERAQAAELGRILKKMHAWKEHTKRGNVWLGLLQRSNG